MSLLPFLLLVICLIEVKPLEGLNATSKIKSIKRTDGESDKLCESCITLAETTACDSIPNSFLDGVGHYSNEWRWKITDKTASAALVLRMSGRVFKLDWKRLCVTGGLEGELAENKESDNKAVILKMFKCNTRYEEDSYCDISECVQDEILIWLNGEHPTEHCYTVSSNFLGKYSLSSFFFQMFQFGRDDYKVPIFLKLKIEASNGFLIWADYGLVAILALLTISAANILIIILALRCGWFEMKYLGCLLGVLGLIVGMIICSGILCLIFLVFYIVLHPLFIIAALVLVCFLFYLFPVTALYSMYRHIANHQ